MKKRILLIVLLLIFISIIPVLAISYSQSFSETLSFIVSYTTQSIPPTPFTMPLPFTVVSTPQSIPPTPFITPLGFTVEYIASGPPPSAINPIFSLGFLTEYSVASTPPTGISFYLPTLVKYSAWTETSIKDYLEGNRIFMVFQCLNYSFSKNFYDGRMDISTQPFNNKYHFALISTKKPYKIKILAPNCTYFYEDNILHIIGNSTQALQIKIIDVVRAYIIGKDFYGNDVQLRDLYFNDTQVSIGYNEVDCGIYKVSFTPINSNFEPSYVKIDGRKYSLQFLQVLNTSAYPTIELHVKIPTKIEASHKVLSVKEKTFVEISGYLKDAIYGKGACGDIKILNETIKTDMSGYFKKYLYLPANQTININLSFAGNDDFKESSATLQVSTYKPSAFVIPEYLIYVAIMVGILIAIAIGVAIGRTVKDTIFQYRASQRKFVKPKLQALNKVVRACLLYFRA
jgi:hypothetical protein